MAYVTTTQLKQRLGNSIYARLTDRVNGATEDNTVGQQIVDEAEGIANSHLSRRYATPIDLVVHPELSDVLTARVLDLAEHIAWRSSPLVASIPDRVLFLFEEAGRWYDAVARGKLDLPAAAPPASRTAVNDAPRVTSTPRSMTHDQLEGL